MLALRDQENLVHAQQTTAAAKPLNQSIKSLQPKTPGTRAPKTPFKPLNDENDPLAFGKRTVKANGNVNGNSTKLAKDVFVTPLGPRNRAPLGFKTTNAKAKGATPAAALKPEKTNKISRGQDIKKVAPHVHPSLFELQERLKEEDVPDIEYMPPKPKELPDDPDDIIYDTTFPQFQGRNRTLGWERIYFHGEVGEDGLTQRERKFKEDSIAYDKLVDEMIQKQVENMELLGINVREHPDEPCLEEIRMRQEEKNLENGSRNQTKHARSVSTTKSRHAAAALSQSRTSNRTYSKPSAKTPTSLKQKTGSSLMVPKKKVPVPTNPSTMRHTAAAAGSRTTLGYSKGRSVSSTLQCKTAKIVPEQPAPNSILSPDKYMQLYGPPPFGSDMWIRCKSAGYFDDDGDKTDLENEEVLLIYEEDEESRNFQLTL